MSEIFILLHRWNVLSWTTTSLDLSKYTYKGRSLDNNSEMTWTVLKKFMGGNRLIELYNLDCINIGDKGILYSLQKPINVGILDISKQCPKLEAFSFRHCSNFYDSSLSPLCTLVELQICVVRICSCLF